MRFTASATTLILLNAAVSTFGQDTEQCRCVASFEHFYDRRSLSQQQPEEGDRSLAFSNYAYDYKDYFVDDEGYYVVEGVRVLPDDDPACDGTADDENRVSTPGSDTTPFKREGILANVFGSGRSLSSHEREMKEDEVEEQLPQLRSLMGMMSSYYYGGDGGKSGNSGKGGKGGKGYDDDGGYDYGKGGKGGKGGMMGGKGDYYDDDGYSKGKVSELLCVDLMLSLRLCCLFMWHCCYYKNSGKLPFKRNWWCNHILHFLITAFSIVVCC